MGGWFDVWAEVAGALAVAALLPLYMGYVHMSPVQWGLYCGVAGGALVLEEYLQFGGLRSASFREFVGELKLRLQLVIGLGAPSYLLALAVL